MNSIPLIFLWRSNFYRFFTDTLMLWQYSVGSIGAKKVILVFGEFVAQWDLMNSDIWLLFQAPLVIL